MNFLQKLDCLMNKYGLNKNTLSQNSDIPYTTIDGWYKKGYEGIKLSTLLKLKDFFNTSLEYLVNDEITDPNYGKTSGFNIEYSEMQHIKKYRTLDEHGKKMVDIVLAEEAVRMEQAKQKPSVPINAKIIALPEPLQSASAGFGDLADDEIAEYIAVVRNNITAKADYVMRVHGNSMEPQIMDGQRVLVRQQAEVETGEIGIFIKDDERFIKVFCGDHLESINPDYPNLPLSEYSRCIGKVLGVLQDNWIIE